MELCAGHPRATAQVPLTVQVPLAHDAVAEPVVLPVASLRSTVAPLGTVPALALHRLLPVPHSRTVPAHDSKGAVEQLPVATQDPLLHTASALPRRVPLASSTVTLALWLYCPLTEAEHALPDWVQLMVELVQPEGLTTVTCVCRPVVPQVCAVSSMATCTRDGASRP